MIKHFPMILSLFTCVNLFWVLSVNAKPLFDYDQLTLISENVFEKISEQPCSPLSFFESEFSKFQKLHKKVYKTVEEKQHRFANFVLSLIKIKKHNELYNKGEKRYMMEVNHLSDKSPEEMSLLNGFRMGNDTGSYYISPAVNLQLPESFDWRDHGAVTEVKNQNHCGSCYAFSSTGALEGQMWRKTGKLISLSEQQIIDCDVDDGGCQGGLMSNVFQYIKEAGGIERESEYEYVSGTTMKPNDICNFIRSNVVATDTGFVQLPSGDEEKLKEALVTVGPISIAISMSDSLKYYKSGIFHDDKCSSIGLNHAVLLVGYGKDNKSGTPYWIIKNSWGPLWGENGYLRLQRNIGSCNIGMYSVYPLV